MKNLSPAQSALLSALAIPRVPQGLSLDDAGHLTPDAHQAVQRTLDGIFSRHRTVGGTVGLVRHGQLLDTFSYGLARKNPDVPAGSDTLYRVASVSKPVFTFAVLRLVEEGLLALDGDVGDVLGYPVRNPAFPHVPVTLRHLLTHTAGLRDAPLYDGPGISGQLTLDQMFTPVNAARNFASTQPGTFFYYSNFGSGIVGAMIEAVTKAPFDDTLQRTLFAPLGISASYAPQRMLPQVARLACGYVVRPFAAPRLAYDAPTLATAPPPVADPARNFMGTPGRLLISVPQAATLLRLLCSDGAVDGVRILTPASMHEMRTPQCRRGSVTGDAGRGLNVAYCPRVLGRVRAIGHQGEAYGMNAEFWADPDTGDGVVMATSGTSMRTVGRFVHCGWAVTRFGFDVLQSLKDEGSFWPGARSGTPSQAAAPR